MSEIRQKFNDRVVPATLISFAARDMRFTYKFKAPRSRNISVSSVANIFEILAIP